MVVAAVMAAAAMDMDTMDTMAAADTAVAAIVAKKHTGRNKGLRCMARPFCITCST
jgi:hypothetical protein